MPIPRRLLPIVIAIGIALVTIASCVDARAQAPRDARGFRNPDPIFERPSFWRWKWQELTGGVPTEPSGGWNIPSMRTDAAALAGATAPAMTWIGHATVLVHIAGKNILFDPIFSDYVAPPFGPRRVPPLPIAIDELPTIDVVMISHNHYDHLDEASVRRLASRQQGGPIFLVPLGLKAWFLERGIERVQEFDWWQSTQQGPLKITFVPANHWSRRTLTDTNETLWGGWVVEGDGLRLIHTGDTAWSPLFREIGKRFGGFDMAFIPIGAYSPRWYMGYVHVDVVEAEEIRVDLNAKRAIGIHWGTYSPLANEPLDEPPRELARVRGALGLTPDQFDVMKIGETRPLK